MTLGPAILALAWFEGMRGSLARALVVFGRVPLFYYLLHVPLIHLAAGLVGLLRFGTTVFGDPGSLPPEWPLGLPVVYLAWAGAVAALYPACRWYAAVKARSRSPWLRYL